MTRTLIAAFHRLFCAVNRDGIRAVLMHQHIHRLGVVFFALLLYVSGVDAWGANNASRPAPEGWAVRIAENFLRLHPDSVTYSLEAKSGKWNYEQGLMLEAFHRMWLTTRDEKYFAYIRNNADHYVRDDGSIATYRFADYNLDNIAPGRPLFYLLEQTKDPKYRIAIDTLRKQLGAQPRTREGGFWHKDRYPHQMWLDGLYMAEPFYAQYAAAFGQVEAFDDIARQFLLASKRMKDPATGLFYHAWDESRTQQWADTATGCSPNFWGRAMGWYLMGLADVLDVFPESHPRRKELLAVFRTLARDLAKFRDAETGLWYQVVDQPKRAGNYREASVSSMITYVYAKGANRGWLDAHYAVLARESFNGILNNLVTTDEDGTIQLHHVCRVAGLGGSPYRAGSFEYYVGEPQRTNDFKGYGPFLLAAIELEQTTKQ